MPVAYGQPIVYTIQKTLVCFSLDVSWLFCVWIAGVLVCVGVFSQPAVCVRARTVHTKCCCLHGPARINSAWTVMTDDEIIFKIRLKKPVCMVFKKTGNKHYTWKRTYYLLTYSTSLPNQKVFVFWPSYEGR